MSKTEGITDRVAVGGVKKVIKDLYQKPNDLMHDDWRVEIDTQFKKC